MSILPEKLVQVLGEDIYKRADKSKVNEALNSLEVGVSDTFREFYYYNAGPFWEEFVPFELLDMVDEENTIQSYTFISRKEYGFPEKYLVLSEISANAVLVLDTVTDKVYTVNFEGGDELLLKGELKETWPTFYEFLKAYFNC
ncbi:SMI1/KNR4 family protein [Peribacillus butanolivorans]|uniref:SMI1/KNR4 family protein n=1 Tax=Peribacillus butanolivorans TaxID=421767 RepID=UPI003653A879